MMGVTVAATLAATAYHFQIGEKNEFRLHHSIHSELVHDDK